MAKGGGISRRRVGDRILSLYPDRFYRRHGLSGTGSAGLIPELQPVQLQMIAIDNLLGSQRDRIWWQGSRVTLPLVAPFLLGTIESHIRQLEAMAPEAVDHRRV